MSPLTTLASTLLVLLGTAPPAPPAPAAPPGCTRENGLVLPAGFCAVILAEGLGRVRHLTVLPNGDVVAAVDGGGGGVVVLRDTDGDGQADLRERFGAQGGTGIGYHDGFLWFGMPDRILRWPWTPGDLRPRSEGEVVVDGLPVGGHRAKSFVFLGGDTLIVNVGSFTNSCQREDRADRSPGLDPCLELESRAGVWQFSAARGGQRPADGTRFATGLRNALALAVSPRTGTVFAVPHGRDQLGANWGFSAVQNAELPAEELLELRPGGDYGWPYCYFDQRQGKHVLAPEYGGDGREVGRCAAVPRPLIAFPGHWAPMAIAFYTGTQFPRRYHGGAFLAFHGSWNRAPLPQEGYRIVFAPVDSNGRPTGAYETFATGAGGPTALRPAGVAVGPEGSLYIGDENRGTIWRVMVQP